MRSTSAMPRAICSPLITIRREQHVAGTQRQTLRDRHRFLAQGTNVKRDFAGALIALHSIIEQPRQQHVAQPDLQFRGIQMRVPRPHGFAAIVEDAHQIERQRADVARSGVDVGSCHGARRGELHITEVGSFARPGGRTGQVQTRVLVHPHNLRPSDLECCIHSGGAR